MRYHTTTSHADALPAYGPNSAAVQPGSHYLTPPETDLEAVLGQPLVPTRQRILTIIAFQRAQDTFNEPLIRRPFHLRKLSDVSLLWRPTSETPLATQEFAGIPHASDAPYSTSVAPPNTSGAGERVSTHVAAVPDVRSMTLYAQVGNTTIPEWAFTIPELRLSTDLTESTLLFDALRFAQLVKRGGKLVEIIKEIAFVEFVSHLDDSAAGDEEFQKAPRDFFATHFDILSKTLAAESAALAAEGGSCAKGITLDNTQSAQEEELTEDESSADKTEKPSRCRRMACASSRLSGRWRFQLRLFREHWRKNRALREARSQIKRKIRLEKRKLKLLEKQQELDRLRSEFLVALHRNDQKAQDHNQAAHKRKLDAELAAQKRKLKDLEYQYHVSKANSKVAAAIRHHEAKLRRLCEARSKAAKRDDVHKSSSQRTSHNSSKRSSLLAPPSQESIATSLAVLAPNSSHSVVAHIQQAPLLRENGCNTRDIEKKLWLSEVDAEICSMLRKIRPVLQISSCIKPLSARTREPSKESSSKDAQSGDSELKGSPSKDSPLKVSSSREPPSEDPSVENSPVEDPPVENSPVENSPVEVASSKDSPLEISLSKELPSKDSSPKEPSPKEPSPKDQPLEDSPSEDPPAKNPPSKDSKLSPSKVSYSKAPGINATLKSLLATFAPDKARTKKMTVKVGPPKKLPLPLVSSVEGCSSQKPTSPMGTVKSAIKKVRKRTPFWLTDEYKKKRKDFADRNEKPKFAPAQFEIDAFFERSKRART